MFRWIAFFCFFVVVFGSLHWYAFRRMQLSGLFPRKIQVLIGLVMAGLVFCPIIIPKMKAFGPGLLTTTVAYLVYYWMAAIFLFVTWSAMLRIGFLILRIPAWFRGTPSVFALTPKTEFMIEAGTVLVLLVYGTFEAATPRFEHLRIPSNLVPGPAPFRIALITDLHLGVLENRRKVERVLRLVEQAKPDLVLSAGDLVDVLFTDGPEIARRFREISPPSGKIAVLGNHEFFAGLEEAVEFHRSAGFKLLRNETVQVGSFLTVAGIDDPHGRGLMNMPPTDPLEVVKGIEPGRFAILLSHQPLLGSGTRGLFDLQLSGHTHGGQLFPFGFAIAAEYGFFPGFHMLDDRSSLYISRGSGSWGPPVRVFSPPEVTVIDLIPEKPTPAN